MSSHKPYGTQPKRGVYRAPRSTDLRSPCPVVNSLANHGFISRDGRNITATEMKAALREIGIAPSLSFPLTYAPWLEHIENPPTGFWAFVSNPIAFLLRHLGVRYCDQINSNGHPYIYLDQLSRKGAIEHDVSLSRRDTEQGDNHSPQKDLVDALIHSSSDGQRITVEDLAYYRRLRLGQQRRDNPTLLFTESQNTLSCGEAAFIQKLFGNKHDGWAVPVPFMKAIFEEERLPFKEGWHKRSSWGSLGLLELSRQTQKFKKTTGPIS